jgi:putative addiction module component (TIGR02574 family)
MAAFGGRQDAKLANPVEIHLPLPSDQNNNIIGEQCYFGYTGHVSITEISQLSLREKFQIMELLWDDMRSSIESAETPEEHKDLLDSRRKRAASGEVSLLDWDQVKNTLGRA